MSLDWNKNGHLDGVDYMITEMLEQEIKNDNRNQRKNNEESCDGDAGWR